MAGIDKIYGSTEEYDKLYNWMEVNCPQWLKHLYPRSGYRDRLRPISNFPKKADKWLLRHCPYNFIKSRIREQYDLNPGEFLD